MTRLEIQSLVNDIQDGVPNTALKVRTAFNAMAWHLTGDVIQIDVATSYIIDNFDSTGLGINERVGYAICNGNNGTRNRMGRVSVQYDPTNYPTLGATGGSKDAVVVSHTHTTKYGATGLGNLYPETPYISNTVGGEGQDVGVTGVDGTDKNMQPYIVTLFIMKL